MLSRQGRGESQALLGKETMRDYWPALAVSLLLAGTIRAQVPRDPFNDPARTEAAPSAPQAAPTGDKSLPPPFVTRQRDVEIPFSVRGGTTPETQPAAVRVFVSWDQGRKWHLYDERRPEDGRFRFQPKQDGEYWFATQTIDRSGRPDSPEPRRPQLRLVVDTQKPQLQVEAQVQESGDVQVSWTAADPTLNSASLKVEYQDAQSSGPWEAVAASGGDAPAGQSLGRATFRPATGGRSINLRAEIADAGGNVAYFSQQLSLAPARPKPTGDLAYSPQADPSATRWPTEPGGSTGPQGNQWIAGSDTAPLEPAGSERVRIPDAIENPYAGAGRLASSPQPSQRTEDILPPPQEKPSQPRTTENYSPAASSTPAQESFLPGDAMDESYGPLPSKEEDTGSNVAPENSIGDLPPGPEFDSGAEVMPAPQESHPQFADEPVDAPAGQRPRLTNSRRFSLDYDVESVGPEGVSAVELWGTSDGGRTWAKWGVDPDRASPFDVEVNNESTYGFRIVIVGKSGLATSAPQSGDAADIWVGIDATRPVARLTGASYGQGQAAGKLEITWEASDANLGPRPITLAIGDRPDGAFTPIAAGLPNAGLYSWEFDPRSPRQIYLRLEVRDEAGNIAIDQLTEPIRVEGLEPKGRIRGFNPAPETNREAFRSPLFQ